MHVCAHIKHLLLSHPCTTHFRQAARPHFPLVLQVSGEGELGHPALTSPLHALNYPLKGETDRLPWVIYFYSLRVSDAS